MVQETPDLSPVSALRKEVLDFEPYSAGLSIEEIQARYGLASVIKLASNENPLGTSPLVQKRLRAKADAVFRYPKPDTPTLTRAIAARVQVEPERIVVGNGSDEIIDLLIRVRATPGRDRVLAFQPSFSMYRLQTRMQGAEFVTVPLEDDLSLNMDKLVSRVDASTAVVFVTTPDNPSGHATPREEILRLARELPPTCLLVVDEAYVDFADPVEAHTLLPFVERHRNLVVLRTFSKAYGLAGLRLGFGVMDPELADYLWRVRLPFSVSILAETAGVAALEDLTFYNATLDTVRQGRVFLAEALASLGCRPRPSQANFLLFRLPDYCALAARAVFERLLAQGIIIRPLDSYGLPDCLRVSIGTETENRAFIQALERVLGEAHTAGPHADSSLGAHDSTPRENEGG